MSQFISLQRNCVGVYVLSGRLQAAASLRPLVFACFINMAMWLSLCCCCPTRQITQPLISQHASGSRHKLSQRGGLGVRCQNASQLACPPDFHEEIYLYIYAVKLLAHKYITLVQKCLCVTIITGMRMMTSQMKTNL